MDGFDSAKYQYAPNEVFKTYESYTYQYLKNKETYPSTHFLECLKKHLEIFIKQSMIESLILNMQTLKMAYIQWNWLKQSIKSNEQKTMGSSKEGANKKQ